MWPDASARAKGQFPIISVVPILFEKGGQFWTMAIKCMIGQE
jgi:hypothetical protein